MANDSILTRAEVESRQRDNIAMRFGECAALNTITQAVELLERVKRGVINDGHMTSQLWTDILYFLDNYNKPLERSKLNDRTN